MKTKAKKAILTRTLGAMVIAFLLLPYSSPGQQQKENTPASKNIATESDVTSLLKVVSFGILLHVEVDKLEDAYLNDSYLFKFKNFLDYNVIGSGSSITVDPDRIIAFIVQKINEKTPHSLISDLLISELNQGTFGGTFDSRENAGSVVSVGGFLTTEFEYNQLEEGEAEPEIEINQAKIFVSARIINTKKNSVNVLAEWNPVREEPSDYTDEFRLPNGDTVTLHQTETEDHIPFERLSVTIENVAGSGFSITTGQIRNPFGFWSDYTAYRNISSTKNNLIVNGFALRKIELGVQIEKQFKSGVGFKTAIVHGRQGRNSSLYPRENLDHKFDFVGRVHYSHNDFTVGASAYFAEFTFNKRNALGADFLITKSNLSVSGEFVYQFNNAPADIYDNVAALPKQLTSLSGYVQYDLRLVDKLHLFGLYEHWDFSRRNSFKAFNGLRYYINRNVKWTIAEVGYLRHAHESEYDQHFRFVTQLEVTF